MLRKSIYTLVLLVLLALVLGLAGHAGAQSGSDPASQTEELLYDEARAVYLGNLARRANGVPPLRWNLQLTHAARWFAWDSTENRPGGYCGHQDTLGGGPGDRALTWGYLGGAGAENAFCGYVTPPDAIQGWMNSPGHRANLLDPNSREIGLGYYRRDSDGRGYVVQHFGSDGVFAPTIINNEAISTTCPAVSLYTYGSKRSGFFAGFGPVTKMMVSNNPDFRDAAWVTYKENKAWTLAGGEGWREVYVKIRDRFNRKLTVSDSIHLGAAVPLNELGAAQMATTQPQVTLYYLNGGSLPQVQLSPGWMADDTFDTFTKWWGNGERVQDTAARGGTAYRLYPGNGESFAWVWDTGFIKDVPMTAYFRLKVSDNTSSDQVARLSVTGGGTEYGPLILNGTDFAAPDQYQEFPVNFTFNSNPADVFLIFNFWQSGNADVYIDAVTIFSVSQPVTSPLTWTVPGGNYRGQVIWARYTDGSQFSGITEADTTPPTISGNAGAAGVTLSYNDGADQTVTADASGNYSIPVPYNWSGTITPSHPCFIFAPDSLSYSHVLDNEINQDYLAAPSGKCESSTFLSSGSADGWILESTETSSAGGSLNNAASTLRLGDETGDRQYRSILSFNTSSLPDGAVVTSARIRLRREGIAGINPFNTHGALVADIRKGSFGLAALQLADFNAAANLTLGGAQCRPPPTGALYNLPLTSAALTRINNAGITQFRLRFEKDDNDDLGADYLRFYSGNAAAAYRPLLVVEYYIP